MIDPSRLTKHETLVIVAALGRYENAKGVLLRTAETERTRNMARADLFVVGDLLRQLAER